MAASETSPRKGDTITYCGHAVGRVTSVEGNLCFYQTANGAASDLFIWRFRDGSLNALHDWPSKSQRQVQ